MLNTRRGFIGLFAAAVLANRASAATSIGQAKSVRGTGLLLSGGSTTNLVSGAALSEGDEVSTGADSLASLLLNEATTINMGSESRVMIDRFLAEMGGVIHIGGAIVFDRPDDMPKLNLKFRSEFGQIGVRGTRFFFGPSKGKVSVFVQRGSVFVQHAGISRAVLAGEGVDLSRTGGPTAVGKWKAPRIEAAFASLGLDP